MVAGSSVYYAPLISAWNSTVAVSGVSSTSGGNPLTSTMTTAEKLGFVAGWMVRSTTPLPCVVLTYQIYNVIVLSEFNGLTAAQQQNIRDILGMGSVDASSGTKVRATLTSIFTSSMQTFANLVALSTQYDSPRVPWWQTQGYGSQISPTDISMAGLS